MEYNFDENFDLYDYYDEYLKTDKGKLHTAKKEASCFIYDKYFLPRFEQFYEDQEECAEFLSSFLNRMGFSFDDFYQYIKEYSLGYGLDYIEDVGRILKPESLEVDESIEF